MVPTLAASNTRNGVDRANAICPLDSLAINPDTGKAHMHVDECWYCGPCAAADGDADVRAYARQAGSMVGVPEYPRPLRRRRRPRSARQAGSMVASRVTRGRSG